MTTDTKAVARWECRVATNASGRPYVDDMEFENGRYVLFTDHERVVAELDRLVRNVDTENEFLSHALAESRAEVEKVRGYEVAPLEAKTAELRAVVEALTSSQTLLGYRWRHSANEKWQFSDIPCGWEYEPVYAAMKEQAE